MNLDNAVCDNINNSMYAYLKNTMSPEALKAAIALRGIAAKDFYYVGQNWYPVFYGDRYVRFTHRGSIEYITPSYEYGTFDYSPHDLYFSLRTGEPLTPDDIFTENWKEAASWTGYLPDGSVGFTGFTAVREVYLPDVPEIILTLSELTIDENTSGVIAFFDVLYLDPVADSEGNVTQSIILSKSLPRYARARLTVPASYIGWDS